MSDTDSSKNEIGNSIPDSPGSSTRGPLRSIVLSATGQDVSHCNGCGLCDGLVMEDMDLTVGEILQAANRDDIQALTNKTLRNFDDLMEHGLQCQAGLDVLSILMTLQREADFRGLNPDQAR